MIVSPPTPSALPGAAEPDPSDTHQYTQPRSITDPIAPMTSASNEARLELLTLPDDALGKIVVALLATPTPLGQRFTNVHLQSLLQLASQNRSFHKILTTSLENSDIPLHLEVQQKQLDQNIVQHAFELIENHGDRLAQITFLALLMDKGGALLDCSHLKAFEQKLELYLQKPNTQLAALANVNNSLLQMADHCVAFDKSELLQSVVDCFKTLEKGYDQLSRTNTWHEITAKSNAFKTQVDFIGLALKVQDYKTVAQQLQIQPTLPQMNTHLCKKLIQLNLDFKRLQLQGAVDQVLAFDLENAKLLLQTLRRSRGSSDEQLKQFANHIECLEQLSDQPENAELWAQLDSKRSPPPPLTLERPAPPTKDEFMQNLGDQRKAFLRLKHTQPEVAAKKYVQPIQKCIQLLSPAANL